MSLLRLNTPLGALMLYVLLVSFHTLTSNLNSLSNSQKVLRCVDMWYVRFLSTILIFSYVVHASRYVATLENQSTRRTRNFDMYCNQMCDVSATSRQTSLWYPKHCGNRFVNIPRRRVIELPSCRLERQLLPMCQHGLIL